MATSPVTPAPTPSPAPSELLSTIVASLQKHTLTMNLMNLVIVLVVLGVFGFIYLHTMQSFQAQLAKADAKDQVYEKTLNDLQTQWKQDQQTIAALQAQKAQISTQIIYRDKSTDSAIQAVTTPGRDSAQVANDVKTAYNFSPVKFDGDMFEFNEAQTQTFVATKLDRDRLSADKTDVQTQLDLETKTNDRNAADLDQAEVQLKSANGVIDGYKKVAKKSFWGKLKDNTLKVALFVGGIYLGSKI